MNGDFLYSISIDPRDTMHHAMDPTTITERSVVKFLAMHKYNPMITRPKSLGALIADLYANPGLRRWAHDTLRGHPSIHHLAALDAGYRATLRAYMAALEAFRDVLRVCDPTTPLCNTLLIEQARVSNCFRATLAAYEALLQDGPIVIHKVMGECNPVWPAMLHIILLRVITNTWEESVSL